MPAHVKAYQRMYRDLARATTQSRQDQLLDEILRCQQEATEWDADQWGFDPDRWMEEERVEMLNRAGPDSPCEPQMRWRSRA